jgi:tRNA nucleotidyltransferase/poly(A) polymerase
MSDYKFMLESHLSAEQNRALVTVQEVAAAEGLAIFLTGGSLRDMLGGFPIRELDFTVEGNALKLVKSLEKKDLGRVVSTDEFKKSAVLLLAGGVTVNIAMARTEKFAKPAAKPKITPATIHDDLKSRDFTMNSIALSLNKASLGLLFDPTIGAADLERRELRTVTNYTLYDEPARMLRMIRLKVRMGLTLHDRTLTQYRNVREQKLESKITAEELRTELIGIAEEANPGAVLEELEKEGLLSLYSPALTGSKLNQAGFAKLLKARQFLPFGVEFPVNWMPLFLSFLVEKLSPKEVSAFLKAAGLSSQDAKAMQQLEANAKKLEKAIKSSKLNKPSLIYRALIGQPGEEILYVLSRSGERLVQDRIKNYLQKYVSVAAEVQDSEVIGATPDSPKFKKLKDALINKRLDARPKKIVVPEAPLPAAPPPMVGRNARSGMARQ